MENKEKKEDSYPYKRFSQPAYFVHMPEYRRTIAMHAVEVSDLNFAVNEFVDGTIGPDKKPEYRTPGRFVLCVGQSKVHPDDNYDRSIGREMSMNKMEITHATILNTFIDRKGILYQVKPDNIDFYIYLYARHGDKLAYPVNA
jgi:hypothetical protein